MILLSEDLVWVKNHTFFILDSLSTKDISAKEDFDFCEYVYNN